MSGSGVSCLQFRLKLCKKLRKAVSVIWSPEHYPRSALGLVYQKQEKKVLGTKLFELQEPLPPPTPKENKIKYTLT